MLYRFQFLFWLIHCGTACSYFAIHPQLRRRDLTVQYGCGGRVEHLSNSPFEVLFWAERHIEYTFVIMVFAFIWYEVTWPLPQRKQMIIISPISNGTNYDDCLSSAIQHKCVLLATQLQYTLSDNCKPTTCLC
jgi:hypothetical protein